MFSLTSTALLSALLATAVSAAALKPRQFPAFDTIPLANSTIKGCDTQIPATEIDDCETLAAQGYLTLAQFLTYNPVLGRDCSAVKTGQAYCIHVPDAQKPKDTELVKPLPPKGKSAPGKTLGAPANCQQWQKIFPEDVKDKKGNCQWLARTWAGSNLSQEQANAWLKSLNTGLAADCSNLEVNTYLCVRVPLQTNKLVQ